jgi:hypothetical protein
MPRFPALQAAYAVHRIATYPLKADKTPAVSRYQRIGATSSATLAARFPDASAAGFVAGPRNRLTVVDIDSTDDRLAEEVEKRFGTTPVRVRTPSGGRHLYYRHQGEKREIRALPDVDVLGTGNVVAALSIVPKGRYEFERSTLDDLDQLPAMKLVDRPAGASGTIPLGRRNMELFRHCQRVVECCDTPERLLDAALTWADGRFAESLPMTEVAKVVGSVWKYRGGRRRVMNHIVGRPVFSALAADPAVMGVFAYLSAVNGPGAEFMIADALGPARGWPRRLVPHVRKKMLALNVIECTRSPAKGRAGLYRWKRTD